MFRRQWVVDLSYFFINSLLIEVLTVFTLQPALILFDWARVDWLIGAIGSMPIVLQVPLIVFVADFMQYWVHRTFHAVPFLWPFHAVHHSAQEMDWLAGSRLHLVDVILTRSLVYVPVFLLGFSQIALYSSSPLRRPSSMQTCDGVFAHCNDGSLPRSAPCGGRTSAVLKTIDLRKTHSASFFGNSDVMSTPSARQVSNSRSGGHRRRFRGCRRLGSTYGFSASHLASRF